MTLSVEILKWLSLQMLKIFARNIRHLTDARYFAAMEVDWLCFDLGEKGISIEAFNAIVEWVEGPKFAIENTNTPPDDEVFYVSKFGSKGTSQNAIFELSLEELIEAHSFLTADTILVQADAIENILSAKEIIEGLSCDIYLEADLSNEEWIALKKNLPEIGIIVNGSDEEKLGFKEFDDLDDLFEKLQEL